MLPQDLLREIQTAAVNTSLDRNALLAGIVPSFIASLPRGSSPAEQIWLDLQALNRTGALADGSEPLRIWLETALHLSGPRREAQAFHLALEGLARASALPASAVRAAPVAALDGPLDVFISYAHQDDALREELRVHLTILEQQGLVRAWHDGKIVPGQDWNDAIAEQLDKAHVILLLVSASFIASPFCAGVEVQRALARRARREAVVIPIIVRPSDLQGAPFMRLQALPKDAKPITKWSDRDEAWTDVVKGIRRAVEAFRKGYTASPSLPPPPNLEAAGSGACDVAERGAARMP